MGQVGGPKSHPTPSDDTVLVENRDLVHKSCTQSIVPAAVVTILVSGDFRQDPANVNNRILLIIAGSCG